MRDGLGAFGLRETAVLLDIARILRKGRPFRVENIGGRMISVKVPFHVLSGFLGAGKTTAVKDLLARRADRERIAVVVNEFGTLGVDGALLSDCASCILKEVPGGCVCCTAMADLEASLEEVSDLVAPTRFVLEPTGLARPSELVDLLRGPRWANRFDVRPVITLLDPQQDLPKAYAESALFRDQVDTGDVLVINRCDLASEEEILRVEEFARALVPAKLLVVRASHGVLPDAVWDLEQQPAPSGTTLLGAPASHHLHGNPLEGHVAKGIAHPPERVYDAALRECSGAQRLERREEEVRVVDPFRGVCDALCDMSFKGISMKVV